MSPGSPLHLAMACIAFGFMSYSCQPVKAQPPQNRLTLNHKVFSNSKVNTAVAEALLENIRRVAEEKLCLEGTISLAIYDYANVNRYEIGIDATPDVFPVQIVWPFEIAPDPLPAQYVTDVDYLTRPNSPNHTLSHEIGHLIFTAYVMNGQIISGGYGSAAPDWLDEAAAILFDHPMQREKRNWMFQKMLQGSKVLTLDTLQRLERTGPERKLRLSADATNGQSPQIQFWNAQLGVVEVGAEQDLSLPAFYSQIDNLLHYLEFNEPEKCPLERVINNSFMASSLKPTKLDDNIRSGLFDPIVLDADHYFSWLGHWANGDTAGGQP